MPTRCFIIVFGVFLKEFVFQNYFWRREKDCRPGRLLFFAAVSLMAWLASGFPSGLFPAVRDLFEIWSSRNSIISFCFWTNSS